MLINPDEVVTGALVNAIAVVGRQISKAAAGLRKPDDDLATARWFETFRLTGTLPDLHGLSPASWERIAEVLGGDEIQATLHELLAARLTDAPETVASRAREALRVALSAGGSDGAAVGGPLAGYYDDQICALVARLEAGDPPLLAQIRRDAFSSRTISILHAIERHTSALAEDEPQGGDGRAAGGYAGWASRALADPPAGRLLGEVTDPFALEVHQPVLFEDAPPGMPVLPAYVPREHDEVLGRVVRAAAEGRSGIAVLVGGSSTGKTRACWEALGLLRDELEPWRLWHPIDPSHQDAALRELPGIGPRTVVWLNEAQFYLGTADTRMSEQVAAGLRELLRDPDRAPVLVLATLWPGFWDSLTARPPASAADPHPHARELMAGHDITVSVAFTATQMDQVRQAQDVRLALAARSVTDGQVTQFLAGAPELLARYRNAPPAARTLIEAAMDARRLGTGAALSQQFLEAAAPGYLTEDEWDALGDDWLEQALAYTAIPCKGARGPLTRIRPRPARPRPSAAATRAHSGPSYRLADYLEQTGRRDRAEITPPISFWEAIASFSEPADLPDLARSALSRGLFRHAAHIYKRAARYDADAAWDLLRLIGRIDPGSTPEAGLWIAHHGALTDVFDLTRLLAALHGERLGTAVTLLAARAAKDAPLDDPERSSELIDAMLEVDAADAAVDTSDRAARTAGVTIPYHVAALLDSLRSTGNHDALNHLARRVITAPAITGYDRARLIAAMSWADNHMVITLADRIAAEIDPPGTDDVTKILVMMHRAGAYHARSLLLQRVLAAGKDLVGTKAGGELRWALRDPHAREAVAALAGEIAQQSDLADATSAAALLRLLWEAGADEIAADIAMRMAGLVQLDDIRTAAHLIRLLHRHGARQAADHLIGQDLISRISVSDPGAVASLLDALHTAGAADSVAAVMRLDPAARAEITDMSEVASLLQALRQTGNIDAANALAVRAADELNANFDGLSDDQMHGALACVLPRLRESQVAHQETDQLCHALVERLDTSDVYKLARLSRVLRDAGEADAVDHLAQRAAGDVDLTDTGRLAFWLSLVTLELRADPAFDSALLNRDPAAYADLTDPKLVADLIVAFNRQGRADAVATLLARDLAGHVDLTRTSEVETLLQVLLRAGAIDAIDVLLNADLVGRADLSNPPVVIELLRTLRAVGAEQAVTALLACLPADYFEITDPDAIDSQLTGLLEIGDADATQKFLAQDPAGNADLTEQPYRLQSINTMQARIGIAGLVATLHKAGADDQATKLADRAANIGKFDLQLNRERFPYGREADGQPSTQWSWHELE